ncbi:MAG: DUF1934 domain-containing protein [Fastidiosipilaceae bacterium]|jgi:uncharacterized beta-barrel protein YwiB (DUF1934 family)|nr:DUF1934 domain-containing protein [Clostridiaceae bacterium]
MKQRFKPITVNMEGTMTAVGSEPHKIQMACPGRLYERDGNFRIVYREPTSSGLGKTLTTVHWQDETMVRIVRTGHSSMTLELRPGERGMSRLKMPLGILTFDVETENIKITETDRGGSIELSYFLDHGANQVIQSLMKISYRYARDDLFDVIKV